MSILIIEAGFNYLLLVDAIATSSESIHYSNCKENVNNKNDDDDGMILNAFENLIYAV